MVLFAKKPRLAYLLSASLLSLGSLASMDAANAGNMYVFKDSNGQVLLTNVVSNNRPAGNNFQNFTKKSKSLITRIPMCIVIAIGAPMKLPYLPVHVAARIATIA